MSDETTSGAIKAVIAVLTWVAARYLPPDVGASLSAYIPTIAAGAVAAAAAGYGIYMHRGQKLVPNNSTAIVLPSAVPGAPMPAPLPVGAKVDLAPLTGVAKVVGALLIGFLILQNVTPAFAQPAVTGNLAKDLATDRANIAKRAASSATTAATDTADSVLAALAKPFQDLATFIGEDIDAAVTLSTAIPSLQDGNGQQCWMGMQQFSAVVKAHPVPLTLKVATDLQALRLSMMAANNLCANPHCTQVFADLSNGVQQLAVGIGSSIPVPSLNAVCSKVPQIAVVAAVTVPATPAPTAAPAKP